MRLLVRYTLSGERACGDVNSRGTRDRARVVFPARTGIKQQSESSMSSKETRQDRRRKRIVADGGKQINVLFSAEPHMNLQKIMARTGRSQVNVLESLVNEEAVERRLDHRP